MRQTNVYSISGTVSKQTDVPGVFDTPYRPDVIKRAVVATASNKRQPYGPSPDAGIKHSVSTWGKGRGVARVQRIKAGRKATESPNNVSGRRAHPPVPERIWDKKVNRKERILARFSAVAATGDADIVRTRGHQFEDNVSFPIIVEDKIQDISSTSEISEVLDNLGLGYDLDRAKFGRKIRPGKGKMRNRRYRTPVSILLVVSDEKQALFLGAANLPGVEVAAVSALNASLLAPGGDAGRLTVFSESAIAKIGEWSL
ncbi:MAG: 50S ribosomal protein L4 [Methanomassiliicoccaceae archaeon]|nr:50S ribosomal protein L4 [Methanomassiliicoccaceae archaeon]